MTTNQAAEHFNVSPAEVRRRISAGELSASMIGGNWQVTVSDNEAAPTDPLLALAESVLGCVIADLDPLLDPQDVANILRVPVRRVRESIRAGDLPSVKLGTRYYVPTPAFVRLLTHGTVAA